MYLSTTLSLAVLEVLVHTDPDLLPDDLVALRIDVVDLGHEEPDVSDLPAEWRAEIGNAGTQSFGGDWLDSQRTPLLLLPSVVLPIDADAPERNALLNPLHPAATDLELGSVTPFSFDTRLISGGERAQGPGV